MLQGHSPSHLSPPGATPAQKPKHPFWYHSPSAPHQGTTVKGTELQLHPAGLTGWAAADAARQPAGARQERFSRCPLEDGR
jgi:hypothetical protein